MNPILWLVAWWAMLLAWPALSHDSWISSGGHRSPITGELCCGDHDCFMLRDEQVRVTAQGHELTFGITAGVEGPIQQEIVPFAEALISQDGKYWRCKHSNGRRRCFFAPPPAT